MDPWPRLFRVGQTSIVYVRFRRPVTGAALVLGGVDFEGDGQDGWYVTGSNVEIVAAIAVTPTKASLPPNGNASGPYNLLGRVRTVEGCEATTGLRRTVTVTP